MAVNRKAVCWALREESHPSVTLLARLPSLCRGPVSLGLLPCCRPLLGGLQGLQDQALAARGTEPLGCPWHREGVRLRAGWAPVMWWGAAGLLLRGWRPGWILQRCFRAGPPSDLSSGPHLGPDPARSLLGVPVQHRSPAMRPVIGRCCGARTHWAGLPGSQPLSPFPSGATCEVVLAPCAPGPCRNGGVCKESEDYESFSCICPMGWQGEASCPAALPGCGPLRPEA